MSELYAVHYSNSYLQHHGIKGMKWGVRRFRNEDGTLTDAGKSRYYDSDGKKTDAGKRLQRNSENANKAISGARNVVSGARQMANASGNQSRNRYNKRPNLTQEEMVIEFEKLYPDFRYDQLEIHTK